MNLLMNIIIRFWIRIRFFKTNLLMSMPILMEIVFFLDAAHGAAHSMPTLQISTQNAHRPASPKEKGQERGGNGTPAMAPAPNEEVTVLVCSGPWKRDKTQSKNRSANTCAVEESSSCLRTTPTEGSRSLMPHPAGHSGFFGSLAAQSARPRFFPVARGAL